METPSHNDQTLDLEHRLQYHQDMWWLRLRAIRVRVIRYQMGLIAIRLDVPEGVISLYQYDKFLHTDDALIRHFAHVASTIIPEAIGWSIGTFTPPRKPPTSTYPKEVEAYATALMAANIEIICASQGMRATPVCRALMFGAFLL